MVLFLVFEKTGSWRFILNLLFEASMAQKMSNSEMSRRGHIVLSLLTFQLSYDIFNQLPGQWKFYAVTSNQPKCWTLWASIHNKMWLLWRHIQYVWKASSRKLCFWRLKAKKRRRCEGIEQTLRSTLDSCRRSHWIKTLKRFES